MIRNIKHATTQKIVNLATEPEKGYQSKEIRANYSIYKSVDDKKKKLPKKEKVGTNFTYSDELEPVSYEQWIFND